MKKLVAMLACLAVVGCSVAAFAGGPVYVRPHIRSDGTYVPGHYRSAPDGNVWNNWSTKGNTNPYTGKPGTVDPYRSTTPGWGSGWPSQNNGHQGYRW